LTGHRTSERGGFSLPWGPLDPAAIVARTRAHRPAEAAPTVIGFSLLEQSGV